MDMMSVSAAAKTKKRLFGLARRWLGLPDDGAIILKLP